MVRQTFFKRIMITDQSDPKTDFVFFQKAVVSQKTYTKTGMESISDRLKSKYNIAFEGDNYKELLSIFYYRFVVKR
jgi:hypothetical protein